MSAQSTKASVYRIADLFQQPRLEIVTIMSALLLLVHSPHASEEIVSVLAFAALLIPRLRNFGPFWIGVAIFRFWNQVPEKWPGLDNHQYLITWWFLGLGLTLMAIDVENAIRRVARLLIGMCFLFATVWKLRSPDFLNGDFFTWTFATDDRLQAFARTFLGLPEGAETINRDAQRLLDLGAIGTTEQIVTGPLLRTASIITACYTVLIEGSVAVLYLLPERFKASRWAPWALLVFIVTVYPIAPVIGFALVLITMAVAALRENKVFFAVAVALFAVLPMFTQFGELFDVID